MEAVAAALARPEVFGTLLLATRLGALLALTPLVHAVPVPPAARMMLTIALAASVASALPAQAPVPQGTGDLLAAVAAEAALGAAMGVGVLVAFAGFSFAGRLLDVQAGFGIGQVLDPVTHAPVPVLTSLFSFLGVLLFLLADGHHALLRAFAFSAARLPPGAGWRFAAAQPWFQHAGTLFALGFALAAPVVLCLFLLELVLAVLARNLPQANMLLLGIPVKTLVALAALALCLPAMSGAIQRLHASLFTGWSTLLESTPPAAAGRR